MCLFDQTGTLMIEFELQKIWLNEYKRLIKNYGHFSGDYSYG
jgi:hypothetical protein